MHVEVLNVGDGACTVVKDDWFRPDGDLSIIDCGAWRSGGAPEAAFAAKSLGQSLGDVGTVVVSHFDADHWWGLRHLAPMFARARAARHGDAGRPRVQLVYPRIPPAVRRLPAGYLAMITTGGTGVRAADLIRSWQAVADVRPLPLRRNDTFDASGTEWRVHWPPASLPMGMGNGVQRALVDLDELAEDMDRAGAPALKRNLAEAYDLDPFPAEPPPFDDQISSARTDRDDLLPEPDNELGDEVDLQPRDDPDHAALADDAELLPPEFRSRFGALARRLARANNLLSLVFESAGGELLVMGDVQDWALKAVARTLRKHYAIVLAPHHGTEPLPPGFPHACIGVAQTGPKHHVSWTQNPSIHGAFDDCVSTHEFGNVARLVHCVWCC